tara:strand:+ start:86 stop:919 length:834 start_codon:yes stop_codon:yes gene_type:complete
LNIFVEEQHPRLDKFLIKYFNGPPMSLIQRLIRKKQILLNDNRCKPSQSIKNKDIISIFYNFKSNEDVENFNLINITDKEKDKFIKLIIYENDKFIVINKPSSIAVQGGTKVKISLKDIYEAVLNIKLYIVHRIDKDTSGLIILTKDRFAASDISKLFVDKKIYKHYLALTDQKFLKNNDVLIHSNNENQIMKLRYRFINSSDTGYIYLVSLLTGRKHQIRLQFSLSKNPIANDIKFNRKESNGLLGLRAYSIKFWYDKKFYNFKLPLKETLKSFDF